MILTDFKCKKCGDVFTVSKESIMDDFPKQACSCGCEDVQRVWSPVKYDVAKGKVGNSETGYKTQVVYHSSQLGKYNGTKVVKS